MCLVFIGVAIVLACNWWTLIHRHLTSSSSDMLWSQNRDNSKGVSSLLEVVISSKNECVFIRDLGVLTVHMIFDARWASMNVGLKWPIAWNNSRHVPLGQFYLHCGSEETRSPCIVCIVCQQVLPHPSHHVTSSMGKQLLGNAHIAKWNKLTESEVTELTSWMVDETALAILKWQGSWGIPILSVQSKMIFDIQFIPYWLKWQTECSKLSAKDFETSEFYQDT
jgi:hypothetical protein